MQAQLIELSTQLGQQLQTQGLQLAVAESCTAGGLAYAITEIPGSSTWFDRGFVCYSNAAKMAMLGVLEQTLAQYGAVSAQTASEMVDGALQNSLADLAIAVTGIAGPDGGSVEKPVGTVFIGIQRKNQPPQTHHRLFVGDRTSIRQQVIAECLRLAMTALNPA